MRETGLPDYAGFAEAWLQGAPLCEVVSALSAPVSIGWASRLRTTLGLYDRDHHRRPIMDRDQEFPCETGSVSQ